MRRVASAIGSHKSSVVDLFSFFLSFSVSSPCFLFARR